MSYINEIKVSIKEITPELAAEYLKYNLENRQIKKDTVSRYAAEMKEGNWLENNQGIGFNIKGILIDGQHRLLAIIESGCTITMAVYENLSSDAIRTVDIGLRRNLADLMTLHGAKNKNMSASALRLVFSYRNHADGRWAWDQRTREPSLGTLLEYYTECRGIDESTLFLSSLISINQRGLRIIQGGGAVALHFLFSEIDKKKADEFFNHTFSGANLNDDHPILTLRQYILNRRIERTLYNREETIAAVIKTWNAWLNKKRLSSNAIKWKNTRINKEPFPVIFDPNKQYTLLENENP